MFRRLLTQQASSSSISKIQSLSSSSIVRRFTTSIQSNYHQAINEIRRRPNKIAIGTSLFALAIIYPYVYWPEYIHINYDQSMEKYARDEEAVLKLSKWGYVTDISYLLSKWYPIKEVESAMRIAKYSTDISHRITAVTYLIPMVQYPYLATKIVHLDGMGDFLTGLLSNEDQQLVSVSSDLLNRLLTSDKVISAIANEYSMGQFVEPLIKFVGDTSKRESTRHLVAQQLEKICENQFIQQRVGINIQQLIEKYSQSNESKLLFDPVTNILLDKRIVSHVENDSLFKSSAVIVGSGLVFTFMCASLLTSMRWKSKGFPIHATKYMATMSGVACSAVYILSVTDNIVKSSYKSRQYINDFLVLPNDIDDILSNLTLYTFYSSLAQMFIVAIAWYRIRYIVTGLLIAKFLAALNSGGDRIVNQTVKNITIEEYKKKTTSTDNK
jgi:hypothetical protein